MKSLQGSFLGNSGEQIKTVEVSTRCSWNYCWLEWQSSVIWGICWVPWGAGSDFQQVLSTWSVGCGMVQGNGRGELTWASYRCDFHTLSLKRLLLSPFFRDGTEAQSHYRATLEFDSVAVRTSLPSHFQGVSVITPSNLVSGSLPGGFGKSSSAGEKMLNCPALDRQAVCVPVSSQPSAPSPCLAQTRSSIRLLSWSELHGSLMQDNLFCV